MIQALVDADSKRRLFLILKPVMYSADSERLLSSSVRARLRHGLMLIQKLMLMLTLTLLVLTQKPMLTALTHLLMLIQKLMLMHLTP